MILKSQDRSRLDQNPPSPLSSITQHARYLSLFSHHAVGRNDLPKFLKLNGSTFSTEFIF